MKALAGLLLAGLAAAPQPPELRFVGCPIYRDTNAGAKSGCWLVDDPASGRRYDVSAAPTKPDWNHAVLVEARAAADSQDFCGGSQLGPVRVSVLDQPCTRFLLEAEGFTGRRFTLPRRNVRPLYETRTPPAKPFAVRTIVVPFDQGSNFVTYQLSDYYVDAAIDYALAVQPARVEVTGFADTAARPVSGLVLREPAALAQSRAEKLGRALIMRGVPPGRIRIRTGGTSASRDEAFDGLEAPSYRRVEIRIVPE